MAQNVPVGLGQPIYDKLDADIAYAMMGINAVKGVEIGRNVTAAAQALGLSRSAMYRRLQRYGL